MIRQRRLLPMLRALVQVLPAVLVLTLPSQALAWRPADLFLACTGDCAVSLFGGPYVTTPMGNVAVGDPLSPTDWEYANDHLIATAVSRRVGRLWVFSLDLEGGIGQRYGLQNETEFWGALFFRYSNFPWNRYLLTSVAFSTGLNWATGVSDVENQKARNDEGTRWMHYFAPEITFALPSHPNSELMFRFHHRSGVFGLVSPAFGGAQYATVGVRYRF